MRELHSSQPELTGGGQSPAGEHSAAGARQEGPGNLSLSSRAGASWTPEPAGLGSTGAVEADNGEETGSRAALAGTVAGTDLEPEQALSQQIAELESWARAIRRNGRLETWFSLVLHALGLLAAAAAAAAGLIGRPDLMMPLCAVTVLGTALLGVWPRAGALAVQRRALCDVRDLENLLELRWHKVRLMVPDPRSRKRVAHALELLELVEARRREIGRYLGSPEPSSSVRR